MSIRTELIKHTNCWVEIEGRITALGQDSSTCIVDIKINGDKVETDHLWFKLKHHLGKGDKIKFKGKIGCYKNFTNYGIIDTEKL